LSPSNDTKPTEVKGKNKFNFEKDDLKGRPPKSGKPSRSQEAIIYTDSSKEDPNIGQRLSYPEIRSTLKSNPTFPTFDKTAMDFIKKLQEIF
jgi:hypothetical protein